MMKWLTGIALAVFFAGMFGLGVAAGAKGHGDFDDIQRVIDIAVFHQMFLR